LRTKTNAGEHGWNGARMWIRKGCPYLFTRRTNASRAGTRCVLYGDHHLRLRGSGARALRVEHEDDQRKKAGREQEPHRGHHGQLFQRPSLA
jgi:hypothetical protein